MASIPTNLTHWEEMVMKDLVPGIGVLTSSGLGFGPLSAVLQCRKTGSLGEVNPDPFPILLGNAVGWVLYAGATRNSYIFAANVRKLHGPRTCCSLLLTKQCASGVECADGILLLLDRVRSHTGLRRSA
eukprot:51732-Rhodomonas_salina.3